MAELIKEPTLVLKLDQKDYLIQPVYSALFIPTNVSNEAWPPCPVGWKFTDWVLVNSSKVTINISRLAWEPLHKFPEGISPSVNDPQGSDLIKLSFDRLMLAPGESAKVSVCVNPTAPDNAEIAVGFTLENVHYTMFVNAKFGSLTMTRKRFLDRGGWSGADEVFDVDVWNRVQTFKG